MPSGLRTAYEPNARMCGQDCEPVLRRPRTVRIPFAVNQNLLVFARTQRELDAPDVLSMHWVSFARQVRKKLVNFAPLMRRT